MITKRKLEIYQQYERDVDSWSRLSTSDERQVMEADDWSVIESLVQDFRLIQEKLVAEGYQEEVIKKASLRCDNAETILELKKIAATTYC